jgi:hypothetical protein
VTLGIAGVFNLWPSSGVQKLEKKNVSETGSVSVLI